MSQYYYLVQAFEAGVVKIWGKESNLKRRGGGEESKFIEEYTPLPQGLISHRSGAQMIL
jgi:hypothetical protein